GQRRILLSDDQRRRLAAKGKILGRRLLAEIGTLFTPDTILRWHHRLIARNGITATADSGGRAGRPSPTRSASWSCVWPEKIPAGATIAFRAPWPTWGMLCALSSASGRGSNSRPPQVARCEACRLCAVPRQRS